MALLPECPECRGPSVPAYFHPEAADAEAVEALPINHRGARTAQAVRCLACGRRFRVQDLEKSLDALDAVDELIRTEGRSALEDMGAAWRKRMAIDRAKYERAMRGEW